MYRVCCSRVYRIIKYIIYITYIMRLYYVYQKNAGVEFLDSTAFVRSAKHETFNFRSYSI